MMMYARIFLHCHSNGDGHHMQARRLARLAVAGKLTTLPNSQPLSFSPIVVANRWDEKAGLRRDAVGSQVIDALEAQTDKGDRQ